LERRRRRQEQGRSSRGGGVPADEVLAEECKGVAEGSVGKAGVFFESKGRAEGGEGVVGGGGVHLRVVGERNADCHVGATSLSRQSAKV
jgi:hypothetical protein